MALPDRFASLDIGSNTVRLLIAEQSEERVFLSLRVERRITRLGGNFSLNGYLAEESISRTVVAVADFVRLSRKEGTKEIFAVATGVVREARNGGNFLERLRKDAGVEVRLLSGAEEAELTFKGILWSLPNAPSSYLVTDIGGRPTENLWIVRGEVRKVRSANLGAVSSVERFLLSDPPQPAEVTLLDEHAKECLREVRRNFEGAGWDARKISPRLVGTAGTITTLAAIDQGLTNYDPGKVNGHFLPLDRVESLFSRLAEVRAAERRKVPGLEEGREDLILAGTRIVLKIMEVFQLDALIVIDSGLLEGVMSEGISKRGLSGRRP